MAARAHTLHEWGAQRLSRAPDPLLRDLVRRLGVEEGSRSYLETLRGPDGPRCPRCDSAVVQRLETRRKYHCGECRYQFRVTAATRMHDSHLPGWKWLIGVDLMLDAPEGFPAERLQQLLGGSYKTAWFLEHRIRAALPEPVDATLRPGRAHQQIGSKYRNAYLAETSWRTSRGKHADRFRTAVEGLLEASPLSYQELVG